MRKSLVIFFSFILMSSFFISGIYAQDENVLVADTPTTDIPADANVNEGVVADEGANVWEANPLNDPEFADAELSTQARITPDSGLYFIEEKILAPLRPDLKNREIKIAEMQVMIEEGNIDAARESFEGYQRYTNELGQKVSPDERNEVRRSSAGIQNAINTIEDKLPNEVQEEFVTGILESEKGLVTAAEIAGKIKELCQQLSELDPNEYSRVCSSERDAPDWRKKLDRELTDEQRQEALEFGEIMSQCFETAGQNCRCEDISFPDFAEACSIAAPLATACEIENNEEACEQLDDLEMPPLPEHLQDIMDDLENSVSGSRMEMHMPFECEEAGAKTPKECAKIMIQTNAPEECKPALLAANVQSEREARGICEKIMFELNAPEECVAAGITDHKECGKLMFRENAPQECIDAGITGGNRDDPKKCQQIMESKFSGGEFGGPQCAPGTKCVPGSQWAPGTGPNSQMSGANCAGIQNSEERLKCYDGAGNYVQKYGQDFKGNFEGTQQKSRECVEECRAKGLESDFSGADCVCKAPEFRTDDRVGPDFNQQYNQQYGDFRDGNYIAPPQNFQPPQGMIPPGDYNYQQPPTTSGAEPYSMGGSAEPTTTQTTTSSEPTQSSSEPTSSSEPAPSESSPVTGGVISNNNFLRFWFLR